MIYLNIKNYFIKKMIDHDLIPHSIRWKKSMSGLGVMYSNFYDMMINEYDIQGIKKLDNTMYNIGFKQGPRNPKRITFRKKYRRMCLCSLNNAQIIRFKK